MWTEDQIKQAQTHLRKGLDAQQTQRGVLRALWDSMLASFINPGLVKSAEMPKLTDEIIRTVISDLNLSPEIIPAKSVLSQIDTTHEGSLEYRLRAELGRGEARELPGLRQVRDPDGRGNETLQYLLEEDTSRKIGYMDRKKLDGTAIAVWKDSGNFDQSPTRLEGLFAAHPQLLPLPEGVVSYRTIGMGGVIEAGSRGFLSLRGHAGGLFRRYNADRLLECEPGDLVTFAHPISSSLHLWRTLLPGLIPNLADEDANKAWERLRDRPRRTRDREKANPEESATAEMAVILELAPRTGLFDSHELSERIDSSAQEEKEIIHPQDTVWQVLGWKDLHFASDRFHGDPVNGYFGTRRHPVLQLKEIEANGTGTSALRVDADLNETGLPGEGWEEYSRRHEGL